LRNERVHSVRSGTAKSRTLELRRDNAAEVSWLLTSGFSLRI
jgi:hypothetical protein